MADLDTRSKRASSVGILVVSTLSLVLPDGTIDQGDRQHTAFSYSGIAAAAPSVATIYYWPADAYAFATHGADAYAFATHGADAYAYETHSGDAYRVPGAVR